MKKEESPNAEIDNALKALLKAVTTVGAEIAPDEVTAKVRVIQAAIAWEKVKYHIKEEDGFDPNAI